MRLSEISALLPFTVERDGTFLSLGLLSHQAERMLAVLYDPAYLAELINNPAVACVVTTPALADRLPAPLGVGTCADPQTVFYQIHDYLLKQTEFYWQDFETE